MTKCETVILSDTARMGHGKDASSPIRTVLEVYSQDGNLIARNDPMGHYTIEDLVALAKYIDSTSPPVNVVNRWLAEIGQSPV